MSANIRTRKQQKAETRAGLIAAARECFRDRGYLATGVADIARQAGVAHGTFYVHFDDKGQVLDEILSDFNAAIVRRLERAWPADASDQPQVLAQKLARVCLDAWQADRELVLAFAERAGVDGALGALRDGISPPIAAFLADRLRVLAGDDSVEAELIAQALLGLWTRVGLQFLFGEAPSKKRTVELLAQLSVGALAGVLPSLNPRTAS
jgi:AcrR family transcriptional regulator